jgi:hypothetical protein
LAHVRFVAIGLEKPKVCPFLLGLDLVCFGGLGLVVLELGSPPQPEHLCFEKYHWPALSRLWYHAFFGSFAAR